MSCWVHAAARDDRCRRQLEDAISSDAKKDECKVALSGEERDIWIGTEAGMLGGTTSKTWCWGAVGQMRLAEWAWDSAAFIRMI